MIKGKTRKNTFRAIYRLLDRVSPLPFDCGSICGAACCQVDEAGDLGMYFLPGEEKIHNPRDPWLIWHRHSTEEYLFPPSWQGDAIFVTCRGPAYCQRALRPLQCRTFPLKPIIRPWQNQAAEDILYQEEGCELALIYPADPLPYCCPLVESGAGLDETFIRTTYLVWKHLIRDPLIYDYIKSGTEANEDVSKK